MYLYLTGTKLQIVKKVKRRAQLTDERFFRRNVLYEASCLHYLLPDKHDSSLTDRLHHAETFELITARSNTISFIPYCLQYYD